MIHFKALALKFIIFFKIIQPIYQIYEIKFIKIILAGSNLGVHKNHKLVLLELHNFATYSLDKD